MANKKILPKTQAQLSQATITPYDKLNQGKSPLQTPKKRGEIRSVKNDDVKQFHIGLRDIDETIVNWVIYSELKVDKGIEIDPFYKIFIDFKF